MHEGIDMVMIMKLVSEVIMMEMNAMLVLYK